MNTPSKPLVYVCVCTYLRPDLIKQCALNLNKLNSPVGFNLEVVVIDNDEAKSAQSIIEELQPNFNWPLHYVNEPNRGIPHARNAALDYTQQHNADYLVFIDDDEWTEPDWLQSMFDYCQSKGGNIIVSGKVIPELPSGLPEHILSIYKKKPKATGSPLDSSATDNVLLPVSIANETKLRFDTSDPFAGGTDTKFFYQLTRLGYEIFYCAEAIVHDIVPPHRATVAWWTKRKFRAGITIAWRKRQQGKSLLYILLTALSEVIIYGLQATFTGLFNLKIKRNKHWLRTSRSAGTLYGVFGGSVSSYKKVETHTTN